MYQIGRAERPAENDPRFDTEEAALAAARRQAVGDTVWAVWRWDTEDYAETLYLVYQGNVWRPA